MEESNSWSAAVAGTLSQCVFCTRLVGGHCCGPFYTPAQGSDVNVPGEARRTYHTLEVTG